MLLLLFRLGAQRYAVPATQVVELAPLPLLSPVEQAFPGMVGLFRYRGHWLPLLDVKLAQHGEPCAAVMSSRVIVVGAAAENQGAALGLLAEGVTETRSAAASVALPPLAGGSEGWLEPVLFEDAEGITRLVRWQALLTPEMRALAAAGPPP